MSDKDQAHLLDELQKARAEVDRLLNAIAKHRHEMREYKGAFYDLELWSVIDPLLGNSENE